MKQTVTTDLRRLRAGRSLSQAELASRAGVTRQTINSIETGKYAPGTELSLRIAGVLGCRVEDIFRLTDASPQISPAELLTRGDRVALGRVGHRVVAHRLSGSRIAPDAFVAADGHALSDGVSLLIPADQLDRSVLIAGCDPSLSILAAFVSRKSPEHRIVPLHSPSETALGELADGFVHIAGSHLQGESNVTGARSALARGGGLVVTYAKWEQGIIVASGNPRGIRGIADLGGRGVRIVNRDSGSGSRRLLDEGLVAAGLAPASISGYETVTLTHMGVGRSIHAGIADAGIGLRAVAHAFGLDFVPLDEFRFDLVIPAQHVEHPTVRVMLDVLQSRHLRADLAALPGYDVSRTGATLLELKAA